MKKIRQLCRRKKFFLRSLPPGSLFAPLAAMLNTVPMSPRQQAMMLEDMGIKRTKIPTVPKLDIDARIFSFPFISIPPNLHKMPNRAAYRNGGSFLYKGM